MRIVVFNGADGWRWHLKARNGRLIATSGEAFAKHGNALRAATKMHGLLKGQARLVDDARH